MEKLHQDYREFLEFLNAHKVEYLVVGSFAMAFHGHPGFTGDIDFWINNIEQNAKRAFNAIMDFGYPPVRIDVLTSVKL